eukprot:g7034.t1
MAKFVASFCAQQSSPASPVEDDGWNFSDRVSLSRVLQDNCLEDSPNKNSCGESCLPVSCLELIVSDVMNWKAQIKAILSLVSVQNNFDDFGDSNAMLKHRVNTLIRENKGLLGKLDRTRKDKIKAEEFIEELQEKIDKLRLENREKILKLMELNTKHQDEMQLLKEQLLQSQVRDQLLKKILNQNSLETDSETAFTRSSERSLSSRNSTYSSTRPRTPEISSPLRKMDSGLSEEDYEILKDSSTSSDGLLIKSKIFSLQETIRSLESQINTRLRSHLSTNSSQKFPPSPHGSDQISAGNLTANQRYNDGSRIPKPAKNRPMSACSIDDIDKSVSSSAHLRRYSTMTPNQSRKLTSNGLRKTPQSQCSFHRRTKQKAIQSTSSFSSLPEIREKPNWCSWN